MTIAVLLSLYYPPSFPSVFLSYAVHSWLFLAHCYLPVLFVLPYLSIYLYIDLFCGSEVEWKWSACGRQKTCWHQSSPYTQWLNSSWQTWKQRPAFACCTIGRAPVCLLNPNFHSSPLLWVCPMKRKYTQSKRTVKKSLVWSHQGQEDVNTLVFNNLGKLLQDAASSCIFQSTQRHFSYAFRWTLLTHRTSHMAKLTHPITKLKIISNLEHNWIVDVETGR